MRLRHRSLIPKSLVGVFKFTLRGISAESKGRFLPEAFFTCTVSRVRTITQIATVQNASKPEISTEQESQENLE